MRKMTSMAAVGLVAVLMVADYVAENLSPPERRLLCVDDRGVVAGEDHPLVDRLPPLTLLPPLSGIVSVDAAVDARDDEVPRQRAG